MSTEVEQQPTGAVVTEKAVIVEENGSAPATETTTVQNGDSKKEDKNGTVKKEPEPPKDFKTQTTEWLNEQNKTIVHKAGFYVLQWVVNEVYAEDDPAKPVLPKSGFVTRNEFVGYFKDGVLLARLANKFQPGAAEAVKEGEDAKSKENQQANMNVFASVAKEHVPEEHQFTHDDLQKGKESFPKLFVNLVQLMIKAPAEHFKQAGGNFDQLITEISSIQDQKFFQKFINGINNIGQHISTFVKKPFNRSNSTVETQPEQNGVHVNGTESTAVNEENGVHTNGIKSEEKKEEVPVVAAN